MYALNWSTLRRSALVTKRTYLKTSDRCCATKNLGLMLCNYGPAHKAEKFLVPWSGQLTESAPCKSEKAREGDFLFQCGTTKNLLCHVPVCVILASSLFSAVQALVSCTEIIYWYYNTSTGAKIELSTGRHRTLSASWLIGIIIIVTRMIH